MTDMPDDPDRRLVALLLLLSGTTGLVDAVSVVGLGKVFTANMTGNIVFLGFAVAPSLVALVFFLAGAVVGGRIQRVTGFRRPRQWLLIIAVIEAALLTA